MSTLIERLSDEADQCRNDGAEDIAKLLDEARAALATADEQVSIFDGKSRSATVRAGASTEELHKALMSVPGDEHGLLTKIHPEWWSPNWHNPANQADRPLIAQLDYVADTIDDLADIGVHWTRNRERGRMPSGIRAAMIQCARELLAHIDGGDQGRPQRIDDLAAGGPKGGT